MTQQQIGMASPVRSGQTGAAAENRTSPRQPRRRRTRQGLVNWRRTAMRSAAVLLAVVVMVAIWEIVCIWKHTDPLLLPHPKEVGRALWNRRALLATNAWPTIQEAGVGFLLGALVGIPFGYIIAIPSKFQSFLTTTILAAQIMPKVAVAPLFIVWFGFGMGPKFFFIFLMTFFPIAMNAQAGFASVPSEVRELGRILGLSRFARLRKMELPWSLPSIFTGLKISGSFTVIGAIVYEFVGSNAGLGHLILSASTNLATDLMFAAIIVTTALGFVFYGIVAVLEVFVIPWHISRRNLR